MSVFKKNLLHLSLSTNPKRHFKTLLSFSILLLCFLTSIYPVQLCADSKVKTRKLYDPLRAKYLKLRNTDVTVVKVKEWKDLAHAFSDFVQRHPNDQNAPAALLDASIVYEKLYRHFSTLSDLKQALKLLDQVARDYPGHRLADDALVRRGDLQFHELKDNVAARRSYLEVVQAYPQADMFPVASDRLEKMSSGKLHSSMQNQLASNVKAEKKDKKRPLIVIDPGHGGDDTGAKGPGGLLEKDVVLSVALELRKLLVEKLGAVVKLTREGDIFVPLMQRTALANDLEADLFISLHTNASEGGKLSGFEVYYLDNTGDKSSHKLAERENASLEFEKGQGDLQFMLSDLIQNAKLEDSILLASLLEKSVSRTIKTQWKTGGVLGVKKAPFYVLVGSYMPSVLVEMYFINHAQEGKHLANPSFRRDLAIGLFFGIRDFLDRLGKYKL